MNSIARNMLSVFVLFFILGGIVSATSLAVTGDANPFSTITAEACCGDGDGGGGNDSCFPAGTEITLSNGDIKNIEDVVVGDVVLSFDTKSGEYVEAEVLELESPIREGYYSINDDLLRMTNEHPIYTKKSNGIVGWASVEPEVSYEDTALRPIYTLEVGDEIFTQDNGWVAVESLTYVEGELQTYNLKSVSTYNTFFADGVLVHNKGDDNPPPPPPPPPEPPVCSISNSDGTIELGEDVTISWNTSHASSVTLNGSSVSRDGSQIFTPNTVGQVTYTIRAVNSDGSVTCKTIVTVEEKPPLECTLEVGTNSIEFGNSTLLSWTTENATTVVVKEGGQSIGNISQNGSILVSPISNTTYTLTATRGNETVQCTNSIEVVTQPPLTCIDYGFDFTVAKWDWTGSTYQLSGSVKSGYNVYLSGTDSAANWTSNPGVDGVLAKASTDYQILNGGTSGTVSKSDIGNGQHNISHVALCGNVVVPEAPECKYFTGDPTSLPFGGGDITLDWHVANADTVTIDNGVGVVSAKDSTVVAVTDDILFTLTATAEGFNSITCNVPIEVADPDPLTCARNVTFTADPTSLPAGGGNVNLDWSATDVDTISIDNGILAETGTLTGNDVASVAVDIIYTLTAKRGDESIDCPISIEVSDPNPERPVCPFTPGTDKTIVEFTERIRSDQTVAKSETEVKLVDLSAGKYNVTLFSWDGYIGRENVTQPNESWKLAFFNGSTEKIRTDAIGDLADFVREASKIEVVNNSLKLTGVITAVQGLHAVFPDTRSPNSVEPICALIERIPDEQDPLTCARNVTFTADPTSLPAGGGNVNLDWSATDVDTISIDNGILAETGTLTGNDVASVAVDIIYTLTAKRGDESVNCPVSIEVADPEPDPISCEANLTFSGDPASLPVGGGDVELSWTSTEVTGVSIDNGVGTVALNGTTSVSITDDTIFTITAEGVGGPINCPIAIAVEDPTPDPISCDANVAFAGNPTNLPAGGGAVELSWTTTDITGISINNGVGTVDLNGTTSVDVTEGITYILTAEGVGGPVDCPLPITVEDPNPDPISCAANVNFSISNTNLPRGGGNVELTWSTTDLTGVSITDVTDPGLSGSATINVAADKTFTLTAEGEGGPISCPVSVTVATGGGGGGGSSRPRCEFFASDENISAGEEITLSWETSRGRDLFIYEGDPDDGDKIFETEDDDIVDEGTLKVRPTKDTTYTLVVERGSRERECEVEIEVKDDVVVSSSRSQGLVAGISLTQVPYTGFEAGPALTMIFYSVLAVWALFIAYMLVIKEDTLLGVSLAGAFTRKKKIADVSTDESPEIPDTSEAAAYVASATPVSQIPTIPNNLPTAIPPVVGYEAAASAVAAAYSSDDTETDLFEQSIEMKELEDRAHAHKVLLSSDAMRHIIEVCPKNINRLVFLEKVIADAKISYPSEDGWVVLNLVRMQELCEKGGITEVDYSTVQVPEDKKINTEEVNVPDGIGSLAESIVTGNITAAYQMIGNRPMFALADAAADLDSVYRGRKGEQVVISDMLARETAKLETSQIGEAINALTGAIDGTYTDEAAAVKMAIMKATKALNT